MNGPCSSRNEAEYGCVTGNASRGVMYGCLATVTTHALRKKDESGVRTA